MALISFSRHLRTRCGVYRPSTGEWLGKSTSLSDWDVGGADTVKWGQPGDIPVPRDYIDEGLQQVAVFRPSEGAWYIKSSTGGINRIVHCGKEGDIPVPLDYFGEGVPRIAVFRPSTGRWYIKGPGFSDWDASEGNAIVQFGKSGDIPIPYDYFLEGLPRFALYRPSEGAFLIKGPGLAPWEASLDNVVIRIGTSGDIPVPANYFNEELPRFAVFSPASGTWFLKGPGRRDWDKSEGNLTIHFGEKGDIPAPGDYFEEKVTRLAVFRPGTGQWLVKGFGPQDWAQSTTGTARLWRNITFTLGAADDIPCPVDFLGQGYLKFAVFRPSRGLWLISARPNVTLKFGQPGDVPVPMDYENVPGESFAIYRPSEGKWYIKGNTEAEWDKSEGNCIMNFGGEGGIPVCLDYFGEGNERLALFFPKEGVWRIKSRGLGDWDEATGLTIRFGQEGDIPLPRDYFGQMNPNLAVWRPSTGSWYIKPHGPEDWDHAPGSMVIAHGQEGDIPVPFNYFDEGLCRLAVYRPATGEWLIKGAGVNDWEKSPGNVVVKFGQAGDVPLPYDYFNEGRPRLALWRPSTGEWFIKGPGMEDWDASLGNIVFKCGQAGDLPFPHLPFSAPFVPAVQKDRTAPPRGRSSIDVGAVPARSTTPTPGQGRM